MISNANNRRVRKTKTSLVNALTQLLKKKPASDISVQELADLADINRSTFYAYYTDVFALLRQIEDEVFDDIASIVSSYTLEQIQGNPLRLLEDVFAFFAERSESSVVLLHTTGTITPDKRISRMIEEIFESGWKNLLPADKKIARYGSKYVISGFVGVLKEWVEAGMKETPQEMAKLVNGIIIQLSPSINLCLTQNFV